MGNTFSAIFNWLHARARSVGVAVMLVLLLSVVGLFFIPLEHSIEVMLPKGSSTQEALRFLREIDFSAKVVISFSQKDDQLNRSDFFAAIDGFVDSLNSPLVVDAVGTFDDQKMMDDLGFFLQRVPELFGEREQAELESRLTPDGISSALRKKYVQLLKPEGSFMGSLVRNDPLDFQQSMIERIRKMSDSFGYDVRIEEGHIVSTDGRHAMVVLETIVPFTDSKGSNELVSYLNGQLAKMHESVSASMVCGHLHTISNEKVIKRDIALTVGVAGTAFILLFLLFFRDARANLIFCIPFAALLIAVNIANALPGTLSSIMLGFGAVIAGIAVDYGIHVYIAVRRGETAEAAVRAVARPVLLGALTTGGVFFAFLFSSIPGYRQLAIFALLSVVFAVAGALLIMPLYLKPNSLRTPTKLAGRSSKRNAIYIVVCFIFLLAVGIPVALNAEFNSDVQALDGTEQKYIDAEHQFQENWGTGEEGQAIAAVEHVDYQEALELNDRLYDLAVEKMSKDDYSNLSRIWKSASHRQANVERWRTFWNADRVKTLRGLIFEKGKEFGFSDEAFDPFFESLATIEMPDANPKDNIILSQIESRFVQSRHGRTQVMSFFPDRPELIEAMLTIKESMPELMLVSRNAISTTLAHDYTREFVRISLIALGLVLAVSIFLLKNLRMTLIVLAPATAGVVSVVAFSSLLGEALNVMNLLSGIIVIGLCIDYGIFYVHAYTHSLKLGTKTAISLSAGTTLIGVGALLFAKHPALFAVGLTLMSGITAGYAVSMLVVPALCDLLLGKERA